MTDDKKNALRMQSNSTSLFDPAKIREQAERRAKSVQQPDFSSMTHEETQQQFHEMQVRQIEAELKNELLRSAFEEKDVTATLLSIVTENMLDMVALTDMEGNFIFAGKSHEILGYEPGFLIGKNVMDFVHPEDLPRIKEEFGESLASGHSRRAEYRYRCKDGSYLWLETIGNFLKDENGNPQEIVFNSRNITERKQAEEAIRKSEEKFRHLFEKAEEGILIVRGETIEFANPALARIMGYPIDKITSEPFINFIHPDDRETVRDLHHRGMQGEIREKRYDCRVITSDNTVKWITLNGQFIDWDGPPANLSFATDITERKRVEDALRESEEKYRLLIDNLNEGVWQIDKDGYTVFVNDRMAEMLGYTVQEMQGRHLFDFMDEQEAQLTKNYMQRRQKGIKEQHEHILICKDGSCIFTSLETSPVYDKGGKYIGALAGVQDVTARKQAEKALRESENYYRAMFETSASTMFIIKEDTTISRVNSNFEKMLGYAKQEVEGKKSWTEFIHPDDLGWMKEYHYMRRRNSLSVPISYEFRFFVRNGELRHGYLTLDIIAGTKQSVASIIDITEQKLAEEERRKSEERYRTILNEMSEGYHEVDLAGNFTFFNEAFLNLFGYSRDEMMGVNFKHYAAEEAAAKKVYRLYNEMYKTGAPIQNSEWDIIRKDGERRTLEFYASVVRDSADIPTGFRGIVRDITERKRVEDKLRESEQKYRFMTEQMNDVVWTTDLEMRITYISPSDERILGFTTEERMAHTLADMLTPFSQEKAMEVISKEYAIEETGSDDSRRFVSIELEYRHKDGSTRLLETLATGIRDDEGRLIGLHGVSRDITERKQAEEALRESEEKFRSTFAASPDSVNINRLEDGLYVDINRGFTRLTGFTREDVIGKTSIEVNIWHDPEDRQKLVRGLRDKGFYENLEARFRRKDGSVAVALMSAAVVHINDEPHIISITREITEIKRMQEALHKSEEKHRRLFETMSQGVIYHASNGEIISANPAAEKILGLSFDQMRGKTSMDPRWKMIKEDGSAVPGTEHPSMIALRTGQTVGPVKRGVFHSGKNSHIWLSITAIPLFREGEAAASQVYATITDITELLERELEYSQILNTSIDGFWVVDTKGHFLEVNPAAVGLLGYTREEMLARRISDIEAIESPEEMDQHIKTIKKQGYERFETQHRHKDGHLLDVEVSASFLAHPYERFIVFTRDISERKQKERESHINRLRLEILHEINNLPEATEKMINDLLLEKMLFLSGSEIGFLGYITDDEEVMEIHSWSDKAIQRCALQDKPMVFPIRQAGLWGEPIRKRKPLIVNDYSQPHSAKQVLPERHVQISNFMAIPVFDEDSSIVAIAAVGNKKGPYDDIDAQQLELLMNQWWEVIRRNRLYKEKNQIEAQLSQAQKMESVGRLAGGVAHDFNNKLSIINGYAELAMEAIDSSDPLQETIQEIYTAGQQSAGIVRQLLAFARKQTISPVMLDLNDTISGMLKMLQRLIGENINLEWHPGNNLWPVKMDPSQVDQIMANLAVNSRDAISDVGKLTIETGNIVADEDYCRGNQEAIPGQYVMLAVTDDGCGIEKEVREQVFDPYFTTKEIGKGTGLGLPTVYGIVKQNNGFINVYSEPGEGTTFKLYFPSHKETRPSLYSAKETTGQIPTGTETFLIVEDEKTILQMSKQMLERLGYTVETATSPSEALQISEKYDGTIHLLITDVVMPEMNGRDLSSQLVKSHPGLKTLYMSGYTADVIAHHGVLDDGVQFIQKPFSLKDLALKVRDVLEQE